MGTTTPNISIYIPAAGETNYDASFAAGMVNIDQHDHSGGPNKGVPIATSGIADGSITYNKLNANVADTTTGIGTSGALGANQLAILGLLKNIYQIATTAGFIAKNGSLATARTFQNTPTITWTNPDGSAGNPSASVNNTEVTSYVAQGSAVGPLVTNTAIDVTSISLPAGTYDVSVQAQFFTNGGAVTGNISWDAGFSATTGTLGTVGLTDTQTGGTGLMPINGVNQVSVILPPVRIVVASTTTYYMVVRGSASGTFTNVMAYGRIKANLVA